MSNLPTNRPVSQTERLIGGLILALLMGLVGVFALTSGLFAGFVDRHPLLRSMKERIGIPDEPLFVADLAGGEGSRHFPLIPQSKLQAPAQVEHYRDNLYIKIDGKEAQFRSFGFVELQFAQYTDPTANTSFEVYLYNMAEPANALGIYMTEKGSVASEFKGGDGGYVSDNSVYFWKGRYYVNVLGPVDGGPEQRDQAQQIATAIVGTLDTQGQRFWADEILPKENRQSSLQYQATSALGHDFLQQLFLVDYKAEGVTYQMFVLKADSPAKARSLFDQFADATAKYDTVLARQDLPNGPQLVSSSLEMFGVTFCKGTYFAGVAECGNRELAEKLAAILQKRIPE